MWNGSFQDLERSKRRSKKCLTGTVLERFLERSGMVGMSDVRATGNEVTMGILTDEQIEKLRFAQKNLELRNEQLKRAEGVKSQLADVVLNELPKNPVMQDRLGELLMADDWGVI